MSRPNCRFVFQFMIIWLLIYILSGITRVGLRPHVRKDNKRKIDSFIPTRSYLIKEI